LANFASFGNIIYTKEHTTAQTYTDTHTRTHSQTYRPTKMPIAKSNCASMQL